MADEMVGWHHNFEQAPADGEAQGILVCSSPRGCKESDTTEQLNKITYKVLPFHTSHYYKE